jgi:hypothetical protein
MFSKLVVATDTSHLVNASLKKGLENRTAICCFKNINNTCQAVFAKKKKAPAHGGEM